MQCDDRRGEGMKESGFCFLLQMVKCERENGAQQSNDEIAKQRNTAEREIGTIQSQPHPLRMTEELIYFFPFPFAALAGFFSSFASGFAPPAAGAFLAALFSSSVYTNVYPHRPQV